MVRKVFLNIAVSILVLSLCGCATLYNPATGRDEFIFINSATEVALGENLKPEIARKHRELKDKALQDRLQSIGRRIAAVSDRQDIKYTFLVLDDKELNAMTIPGGTIYVNKGLMDVLNDDELAYVLAHEAGHISARHIAKKIQANMAYQLLLGLAFAGVGGDTQAIKEGTDVLYGLVSLSYSRKDEYEADRLAVKYCHKAGFDPYASISALERIKKEEGPNWKVLSYFRTHPYVDERIAALKTVIPQITQQKSP